MLTYIPSYEGLYNIFIGLIIGRENNLNPDYLFLSDLHSSLCMGINYSTFRSDKEGILFNERLYQHRFERTFGTQIRNAFRHVT